MDKPLIAGTGPVKVTLEKDGNYAWCACGRSDKQPFCDGSHRGTTMKKVKFFPEESAEKWLCMCKRTQTPPFCDGSHSFLTDEERASIDGSKS